MLPQRFAMHFCDFLLPAVCRRLWPSGRLELGSLL